MIHGMDVTIRRAESNDLRALGALGALLVRTHHAFDNQRFMQPGVNIEDGYAWFLGTQLDESEAIVYVAERKGAIVGYVYGCIEPLSWKELRDRAGFIHDVVVMPEARRSGIARSLVEAAATWLESAGAPRVMLWTAEKNTSAQSLFARLGFRRTMIEMTREPGSKP
jgi:ribosomal protein S18 acetylase RimI-like enzyme